MDVLATRAKIRAKVFGRAFLTDEPTRADAGLHRAEAVALRSDATALRQDLLRILPPSGHLQNCFARRVNSWRRQ